MKPKKVAQDKFTILIDMDGVLADFVGGVEEEFDVDLTGIDHWGMWDEIGISPEEFWKTIQQNNRFWADLKPYPWARSLINTVDEWAKGDTCIVTSPDRAVSTFAQKAYWVYNHFPHYNRKLFIGARKELMADDTTILIDDSQKNCDKFKDHGGSAITFPQLWNDLNQEPDMSCIKHVEASIEEIVNQWSNTATN